MYQPILPNSTVVFVNPSTPDGKYYDIDNLLDMWISKNATIIIDESFLDFCIHKSSIEFIQDYDKLYIIKSMTKFFGSAGIRIGSIISKHTNIKSLSQYTPAWQLSTFDMTYITKAIDDKSLQTKTLSSLQTNKSKLISLLQRSKYVSYI
jgi:threonine-phosphate decarboxylase